MLDREMYENLNKEYSTDTPCVSIFIPTHRVGHVQEDKIRFKNALTEVKQKLQNDSLFINGGMIERQAEGFLTPAYDLLDNNDFWLHLSDGLAVFLGKNRFEHYTVPIDLNPVTYVKHQYYLMPLLPLLKGEARFFLLALSQGEVRFFEGRRYSIFPVKISDLVPKDMDEAMALEDPEKNLQMRNVGAEGASIYHGHGIYKDQQDWQIEQYCRMVDNGLLKMLHDEKAPMIIAALDELASVYKKVSNYSNVMDFHISGNPENDDPVLLHEKAWDKMKGFFRQEMEQQKERFEEMLANGKGSFSIHNIVPAAVNCQVETLFISKDASVLWGAYDAAKNTISIHEKEGPHSVCLHNLAATKTFDQGGRVYNLDHSEMLRPAAQVNAIFRY